MSKLFSPENIIAAPKPEKVNRGNRVYLFFLKNPVFMSAKANTDSLAFMVKQLAQLKTPGVQAALIVDGSLD